MISEIDWRNIKCVVLVDSYDPPESIGTKKSTNIPCMTPQWRHKCRHAKNTKIAKILVFRYFFAIFSSKVAFFGNDVCQSMLTHVLTPKINQINTIKHSESVSREQKTRFVCNFHWKSVFDQFFVGLALYYAMLRHNTRSDLKKKMVLNWAQGLKKKSWSFSAKKITTGWDITKKCWGGRIPPPPRLF